MDTSADVADATTHVRPNKYLYANISYSRNDVYKTFGDTGTVPSGIVGGRDTVRSRTGLRIPPKQFKSSLACRLEKLSRTNKLKQ